MDRIVLQPAHSSWPVIASQQGQGLRVSELTWATGKTHATVAPVSCTRTRRVREGLTLFETVRIQIIHSPRLEKIGVDTGFAQYSTKAPARPRRPATSVPGRRVRRTHGYGGHPWPPRRQNMELWCIGAPRGLACVRASDHNHASPRADPGSASLQRRTRTTSSWRTVSDTAGSRDGAQHERRSVDHARLAERLRLFLSPRDLSLVRPDLVGGLSSRTVIMKCAACSTANRAAGLLLL